MGLILYGIQLLWMIIIRGLVRSINGIGLIFEKKMRAIITIIILLFCLEVLPQRYFADYMIVGSSVTYISDSDENESNRSYYDVYNEFTWNINVGIRLSKRFFSGIQVLNIYASEKNTPKNYYSIYGLFTQFNVLNHKTHRLFAEVSLNMGDYFTGGDTPHEVDGLYYFGLGAGYDMPIKWINNLYLDLSFLNYRVFNNIEGKDNYTQYVIGLNYRLNTGG